MRIISSLLRGASAIGGRLRTWGARECAQLDRGARLKWSASIDNIHGDRSRVRIGRNSVVSGHLQIFAHGGQIRIGDWSFVGEGSRIWSAESVDIGDRVLISHDVNIIDTDSHPIEADLRFEQTKSILTMGHPRTDPGLISEAIRIGDDAWISYGAAVLRGVTIGEGAIVGACSVVTSDVPPWTVVAGNPAREIRRLEPGAPRSPVQAVAGR
jgi:acetyltransferase-like isoleucine patch superfamily enzyme